ncbi:MAG: hypothetical protein AAF655_25855 [Bacteroidota bacterium]
MQYQEPHDPERGAFSTHFQALEAEPPHSVWEKLDGRLEENNRQEHSKKLFYSMAASLLLLGIVSFSLFLLTPKNEPNLSDNEVATLTNKERIPPALQENYSQEEKKEVSEAEGEKNIKTSPSPNLLPIPAQEFSGAEVVREEELLAMAEEIPEETLLVEVPTPETETLDLAPIRDIPVVSVSASKQELQAVEIEMITKPISPKRELRIKLGPLQITHKNYRQKTNSSRS